MVVIIWCIFLECICVVRGEFYCYVVFCWFFVGIFGGLVGEVVDLFISFFLLLYFFNFEVVIFSLKFDYVDSWMVWWLKWMKNDYKGWWEIEIIKIKINL